MIKKKNIIGICGSASENSGNLTILKKIVESVKSDFNFEIIDDLSELPHFKTKLTDQNVPEKIIELREKIANADGIIIATPEYIFSIPSGLKNLIEWCVSTTVFSEKPVGLITASSNGIRGHEELKLLMKTIEAHFTAETTLLVQGIKGKISSEGSITDENIKNELKKFMDAFTDLTQNTA